jgi:hypothetical protein
MPWSPSGPNDEYDPSQTPTQEGLGKVLTDFQSYLRFAEITGAFPSSIEIAQAIERGGPEGEKYGQALRRIARESGAPPKGGGPFAPRSPKGPER